MRGLEGQDDFAAMAQVVARRFARLRDAASPDRYDESFAAVPNLVVIDGGKGQLAAALEAIHATYDLPRVAVVALAKREEEVFVPGPVGADPARPPRPGPAAAPAARDEAHRFALGFHRRRRDTRAFESIFDDLEGIGPARRRAILQPLRLGRLVPRGVAGGARGRARAAREDGAAVYAQLHKAGRGLGRRRRSLSEALAMPTLAALLGSSADPGGPETTEPEADRAEREEDRGEADDDVDDRERQLHADAEGEERRAGDADSRNA